MATRTRTAATEQDLLASPRDGRKYELVDGAVVVSPAGSRHGRVSQAGVRAIWVIDPEGRKATVYRSLTDVHVLAANESIDGGDVIPGFRCPVGELFD